MNMTPIFSKLFLAPTACVLFSTIGVVGGSFLSPAKALDIGGGNTVFDNPSPKSFTLKKESEYKSWIVENNTNHDWTHFTFTSSGGFKFIKENGARFDIPFNGKKPWSLPLILAQGNSKDLFNLDAFLGGGTLTVEQDTTFTGQPSPVPSPLPILGIVSAYRFSRKLRKRIKHSNEALVALASNN